MKFLGNTIQASIPAGSTVSLTSASTVTIPIQMQPMRLEGFWIDFSYTNAGTTPTGGGPEGAVGFIREIRLKVNEKNGKGQRNLVKVTGAGVLAFVKQNNIQLGRYTAQAYAAGKNLVASAAHRVLLYVPVRALFIEEPFGNLTSLPLSNAWLNENPTIEIDIRAGSEIYATNPATTSQLKVALDLRDVPPAVGYMPAELVTDKFSVTSLTGARYEVPSGGFLTQMLVQGYDSKSFGPTTARAYFGSSGGLIAWEYGRTTQKKFWQELILEKNDMTAAPLNAALGAEATARAFNDEFMVDFITDVPQGSAFSAESIPNLNPDALSGDRAALVFYDAANANYQANITYHKLLARNVEEMKPLFAAI